MCEAESGALRGTSNVDVDLPINVLPPKNRRAGEYKVGPGMHNDRTSGWCVRTAL